MPKTTDNPVADASQDQDATPDRFADVAELGYEDARDELTRIVATLEAGSVSLEESMRLWERGEALAAHCHSWLNDAQERVQKITGDSAE